MAIVAVSAVLLFVAHTLPNYHSTGTRDGETYSPSTFNPYYGDDYRGSGIARLLEILAPLLSTLLPLLCLLIVCFRSTRMWDTLKGIVAGVPLATGLPYFVATLSSHLTISGYNHESLDYEIGSGIYLREGATALMTLGAILFLVAIIREKPLGTSESSYLPSQSPSTAAALPYPGGLQSQLTGSPYPSAPYYTWQQPAGPNSLTQHEAARMDSASGEGKANGEENSGPKDSHSRYAPPNHPARVSQSDQASALHSPASSAPHSPASQRAGAIPTGHAGVPTGLPGSGLPPGSWAMQGHDLAPSLAAYGPEHTGFRPVRAGLTTGKWATVLTLAISGLLFGFLSLFVPFINLNGDSRYVGEGVSGIDLQRWNTVINNSFVRMPGGFNMFLYSLLTIMAAVLFVFLVGLHRRLARWVAFVAGGGLITAGAIMLILLALLGSSLGQIAAVMDDITDSEGGELSLDVGAFVYGMSLTLLIVSGLLFCIFSAQRPATFFTPGVPVQYPGQVGGFAGQSAMPAGQQVATNGQPVAAGGQQVPTNGQPEMPAGQQVATGGQPGTPTGQP